MPKQVVSSDRYSKIVREAEAVESMTHSEGWKVLREDLKRQARQIERQLAENRLRTVTETIVSPQGSKTFTTTAETQIAENAGMYKQIQQLFKMVETIVDAPKRLHELEAKGVVAIEKTKEETS